MLAFVVEVGPPEGLLHLVVFLNLSIRKYGTKLSALVWFFLVLLVCKGCKSNKSHIQASELQ